MNWKAKTERRTVSGGLIQPPRTSGEGRRADRVQAASGLKKPG
ncbi:hypothetical protein HMPREF9154_0832 [Arachnia propionica F0230a]|nr:hypothetical protein HMPREF9154_0832 [Arachnia propionica F0230a]